MALCDTNLYLRNLTAKEFQDILRRAVEASSAIEEDT